MRYDAVEPNIYASLNLQANLAISLRKNDGDKKGKMNEKVDGFAAEAAQPAIQLIQVTSNDRSSS